MPLSITENVTTSSKDSNRRRKFCDKSVNCSLNDLAFIFCLQNTDIRMDLTMSAS